ncbi:endo-1,4-beta-glucanase [Mycobacterium tuberculosis CAS/NITR204]|uniref:Endo-1,4-beta-glucanase n=1 Tax=Mycobacterium tuberculosis CAS/NITR204 TaxID=1310114 RepID=R4MDF9_MYCTX|nr:endo-1,4-beta-glucanase [Mycobacterium tuberculosis CAS/NITR204]
MRVVRAPALILVDAANPLAGKPFYVDPASAAMVAARNANPPNAELTSVANTPQSYWLDQAFPPATVGGTVARYTGAPVRRRHAGSDAVWNPPSRLR